MSCRSNPAIPRLDWAGGVTPTKLWHPAELGPPRPASPSLGLRTLHKAVAFVPAGTAGLGASGPKRHVPSVSSADLLPSRLQKKTATRPNAPATVHQAIPCIQVLGDELQTRRRDFRLPYAYRAACQ